VRMSGAQATLKEGGWLSIALAEAQKQDLRYLFDILTKQTSLNPSLQYSPELTEAGTRPLALPRPSQSRYLQGHSESKLEGWRCLLQRNVGNLWLIN